MYCHPCLSTGYKEIFEEKKLGKSRKGEGQSLNVEFFIEALPKGVLIGPLRQYIDCGFPFRPI